jgi:site-specific DNA-methyltransferase (adenine-specific)
VQIQPSYGKVINMQGTVYHNNCLNILSSIPNESIDLVCTDPPFNTGNIQIGSKGASYTDSMLLQAYVQWMKVVMVEVKRVLAPHGTVYVHLDWHAVHYIKVMMDDVFGIDNFLNEIIWSYDYGGRGKCRFPRKHDNILVYTKQMNAHVFEWDAIDRIPYMAPGLQKDKARAALGKVPTDVWWNTIVPTQGVQRTGYPTQKPLKIYERMIKSSSKAGSTVLDPFAGSGTTAVAAEVSGRNWIMIDENVQAIDVMKKRFVSEIPNSMIKWL